MLEKIAWACDKTLTMTFPYIDYKYQFIDKL